jgi:hypothetical protein
LLFGPPADNITVLRDAIDHTSPTSPFITSLPDGTTALHAIASESLTQPPISSIAISIDFLDALPVDMDEEMDMDPDSSTTPPPPPSLLVHAEQKPYDTIGEYVLAVHAWLNPMQDTVLSALEQSFGPLPCYRDRAPGHRVWVWIIDPSGVSLEEEEVPEQWPAAWEQRDYLAAKIVTRAREAAGAGAGAGGAG